ncbi:MAG TPA: AraC family transcriptional regulator [Ideonella sp.]|nr:AraC family transcriptional regulator [Ideonella sp.]
MRELDVGALAPDSGCSLVADGSEAAPEFLVAENGGNHMLAARWRRGDVPLTETRHMADYLLSYCAAGAAACTVYADGQRLFSQQRPRSLTLLRAGQALQWQLDVPDDVVHIHLYLSAGSVAGFAREHLEMHEAPLLRNVMGIRDPWLDSFFRLLISEYETYARDLRLGDSLFLDQTESLLVGYLVSRYAENAGIGGRAAASRVSALRPLILRRVEAYVNDNLAGAVRLGGMAEVAAMSSGHFTRAFQRATGMTPHQYVVTRRLDKARELLRDQSTSIAEIAQQCGFSGTAHFSMTFRHHHALTPSQYRQMQ